MRWTISLPIINIDDLRLRAKARLPRVAFDYLDGGADDELTLRENSRVFDDVVFRPRYGEPVPAVDLSTAVLGQRIAVPWILAPIGSSRMFWPLAEARAAAAAGAADTIYTLSTLSGTRLEEVKAATPGPCWRSEERRVGKECRSRGAPEHENNK